MEELEETHYSLHAGNNMRASFPSSSAHQWVYVMTSPCILSRCLLTPSLGRPTTHSLHIHPETDHRNSAPSS